MTTVTSTGGFRTPQKLRVTAALHVVTALALAHVTQQLGSAGVDMFHWSESGATQQIATRPDFRQSLGNTGRREKCLSVFFLFSIFRLFTGSPVCGFPTEFKEAVSFIES